MAAPETLAVVDGFGGSVSYGELDERSNRLARWLIGRGVGADDLVVLAIPRSVELLVAVWGVAKAGAGMCRWIRVSGGSASTWWLMGVLGWGWRLRVLMVWWIVEWGGWGLGWMGSWRVCRGCRCGVMS